MNIDELNIKVSSNTKSAKSGIDNLTSALKVLSEIDLSNIQSLISGLEKISTALTGNKSSTSGANGIKKVSQETNKIKYSVENATPKIAELKEELKGLSNQDLSFGDKEFDKTFTQLQQNRDELKKYKKNLVAVANATKTPKKIWSEEEIKNLDEVVSRAVSAKKAVESVGQSVSKEFGNATEKATKIPLTDKMKMMNEDDKKVQQIMSEVRKKWFNLSFEQQQATLDATGIKNTTEFFSRVYEAACKGEKAFEKFSHTGDSSVKKIKGSVTETTPKIEELKESLRELSNQGLTFGDKKFDSTYQELQKNISALKAYKSDLDNANISAKKMVLPLSKVSVLLKGLSKASKSFGKGLLNGAKKAISNGIKPLSEGIKQFKNMLKSMITRSILYTAMSAVRDGFGILAKEDSKFNKSMSRMYSSLMTLKNAFVAAFAPIVETVEPCITSLLNMLTQVVTKVTQVLAALTGSSSATIAKKLTLDYADAMDESSSSTDKAAKSNEKFKKSLMGFDEINKLNGDDSSLGDNSVGNNFTMQFTTGGANDLANMIKKAWQDADFTDIGKIISSKMVGMTQKIPWEEIKNNAFKGGKSFATLINGLFSYTDKDGNTLSTSIGKTIGESFNTLVDFVYGYVSNLKWKNIGTELAKGLLKTIKTIKWDKFGTTIHDFVVGLFDMISSFFEKLCEDEAQSQTISNAITDLLNGLQLDDITLHLVNALISVAGFTLSLVGNLILDLEKATIKPVAISIGEFIADGAYDIGVWLDEHICQPIHDWIWGDGTDSPSWLGRMFSSGLYQGMTDWIVEKFEKLSNFVSEYIYDPLAEDAEVHSPSKLFARLGAFLAEGLYNGFKDWVTDKLADFQERGRNIKASITDGLSNMWGSAQDKFSTFSTNINTWFSDKKESFKAKGTNLKENIKLGIGNIWSSTGNNFNTFWSSLTNFFNGKKGNAQGLGSGITSSIKTGLGNNLWSSTSYIFTNFWRDLKNYLGSETLKLSVEWDTTSTLGQALSKIGLQGMPRLSFYAEGGFPNIGELFVANERGAEMVGSLNNRPAVANNQQIENALENAIYRGMMAAGSNGSKNINLNVTVPLDNAVLGRAMVDYHNGYVRSTGGSPLIIGG